MFAEVLSYRFHRARKIAFEMKLQNNKLDISKHLDFEIYYDFRISVSNVGEN